MTASESLFAEMTLRALAAKRDWPFDDTEMPTVYGEISLWTQIHDPYLWIQEPKMRDEIRRDFERTWGR